MDVETVARPAADLPSHAVAVKQRSITARCLHDMSFPQALFGHYPGRVVFAASEMQPKPRHGIMCAHCDAARAHKIVEGEWCHRHELSVVFGVRRGYVGVRCPRVIRDRAAFHTEWLENSIFYQPLEWFTGSRRHASASAATTNPRLQ